MAEPADELHVSYDKDGWRFEGLGRPANTFVKFYGSSIVIYAFQSLATSIMDIYFQHMHKMCLCETQTNECTT